jgi:hypothetical protein
MRKSDILHNNVTKVLLEAGLRKTKVDAITDMTGSLISDSKLTLTSIGRNISGCSKVKHKIKRVDRCLKNDGLFDSQLLIY